MWLYHIPRLLVRNNITQIKLSFLQIQLFKSEESQTRRQTCLHTQCKTCIALLIHTAQLENKAWKTVIDCSVPSTCIPRLPINIQSFPKDTHTQGLDPTSERCKLRWLCDTTILMTCLITTAATFQKREQSVLQTQVVKSNKQKLRPLLHRHSTGASESTAYTVTCHHSWGHLPGGWCHTRS